MHVPHAAHAGSCVSASVHPQDRPHGEEQGPTFQRGLGRAGQTRGAQRGRVQGAAGSPHVLCGTKISPELLEGDVAREVGAGGPHRAWHTLRSPGLLPAPQKGLSPQGGPGPSPLSRHAPHPHPFLRPEHPAVSLSPRTPHKAFHTHWHIWRRQQMLECRKVKIYETADFLL